ncbi:uncharacterized protein LOC100158974 isoform X2 [Acyrthosiphon pisum]|uniref:Uncharacterized protein n=1 Tax=Acyrthosiphon pisum TaxID=7029 RepID=A0A8R2B8S6_ACYPI|nr:uncharacterized protein LOC100158974 isoform X2 [Acyrthosiphon pisum]XP_060862764.1 uncharacterized protein LOC132939551 isoform X2 [Metopolophium dirhodum]XP_060881897.1 uncharacterized protein LOC132953527 isoform X2 [Metopolophium dirhodum]|eukprot:XP_008186601.1 PREDICTED: uncharacterized protein LOC100158974 isoform X2 [Acyrthosiphon pisum]
MTNKQAIGWAFLCLMGTTLMAPAVLTYPQEHRSSQTPSQYEPQRPVYQGNYPVYQPEQDARKFVEKPNASKKVVSSTGVVEDRNDLEDVQTNSISQDAAGGFSWSSVLGMIMQMLFNPASQAAGPSKSDVLDGDQAIAPTSPWANLLSVGLKILTAFLGGGNVAGDGIDKVDNSSPMQFINIVVNLLDALKTSFSHRSMSARSLGKKDTMSDAAVASLSMFKGYMKTMNTANDVCAQKFVCEANKECSGETSSSSAIYCQLGTYATSFLLQRTGNAPFEVYYDAGRRGRSGDDCRQLYLACNEV